MHPPIAKKPFVTPVFLIENTNFTENSKFVLVLAGQKCKEVTFDTQEHSPIVLTARVVHNTYLYVHKTLV